MQLDDKAGADFDRGLFRRMVAFAWPYRRTFLASLLLALGVSAVELGLPALMKTAIDGCLAPATRLSAASPARQPLIARLDLLAAAFLGAIVLRYSLMVWQGYLLQVAGQSIMRDLRRGIMAKVLSLPVRFFDRNPVGRLVTRASNDVAAINELYAAFLLNLIKDVITFVGVLAVTAWMDWRLCLLVLALAPPMGAVSWFFRGRMREAFRDFRAKLARLNAWLQERITGMPVVQAFAQEPRSFREFTLVNGDEYRAHMRQLMIFAVFQPVIHLFNVGAVVLVVWRGGFDVIGAGLTVGMLVAYLSYLEMLFAPIRDLAEKYGVLQGAMAAAERIAELLDEPVEDVGRGLRPRACAGEIEFQGVWFSYVDPVDGPWALRGASFTVRAGSSAALVGPTGSGKTTIINLLLRFHDPGRGRILLDGVDLRDLDVPWLRTRMAVVLQDVFLFAGDLGDNISLREPSIAPGRIADAAAATHADVFIARLPAGMRTPVGERGAGFSAGERQLIAFARAVTADPRVLVLDEATANIDSRTEHLIQDSLARLLAGRTALIIAHRLSTIREADQILVLRAGEVAERGTHRELLAQGGLYSALHRSQTVAEELRGHERRETPADGAVAAAGDAVDGMGWPVAEGG